MWKKWDFLIRFAIKILIRKGGKEQQREGGWEGGFGQKSWVTMGVSTSGYTSAAS